MLLVNGLKDGGSGLAEVVVKVGELRARWAAAADREKPERVGGRWMSLIWRKEGLAHANFVKDSISNPVHD